jgi:hypothetical protein
MASGKGSPHEKFVSGLSADERTLLTLRDELYGGSWDQMRGDLKDRLGNKPYIFKLVNRIQDDLKRIDKLSDYEQKNKVNLSDFLKKKEAK